MSVARYSAKGFVPAISTYHARNHVFFNVVNSLIPGAIPRCQ